MSSSSSNFDRALVQKALRKLAGGMDKDPKPHKGHKKGKITQIGANTTKESPDSHFKPIKTTRNTGTPGKKMFKSKYQ